MNETSGAFLITSLPDSSSPEDYTDYVNPNFPKWFLIVLFVIGIFGNILSLSVFHKMNVRQNSTYIYLSILCLVDITVLVLGLGDMIILFYFNLIVRNESIFVCRIHTFLLYTFTHWSSFILAAVSIDRAIAVKLINFARKYCKPNMAHRVIVGSFLLAALLNFHTLLFLGYELNDTNSVTNIINATSSNENNNTKLTSKFYCASRVGWYDTFLYPYFDWIDLLVYTIIPFFIMAICTFIIVKVLYDSKKRLKQMGKKKLNNKVETKELIKNETKQAKPVSRAKKNPNTKKNKQTMQLTYTLISINILFVLFLGPISVLRIFMSTFPEWDSLKDLVGSFYLLAYSNHCFNFIFYGLSSKLYRDSMFELFRINHNGATERANEVV